MEEMVCYFFLISFFIIIILLFFVIYFSFFFKNIVIEFAGDSVLCLFKTDGKNIQGCCHQAVRCGLHISKYQIDGTHTHVGISYGSVTLSLVGGFNDQYTYLMNSKSLEKVGECLSLAGQQELVIADDVFPHVESLITSSIVNDSNGKEYYKVTGERSNWQVSILFLYLSFSFSLIFFIFLIYFIN